MAAFIYIFYYSDYSETTTLAFAHSGKALLSFDRFY